MDKTLDLMRDASKNFPNIDEPLLVERLRVWHCKYRSLSNISNMSNLEELVIGSLPDDSFAFLSNLKRLKYLSVVHMPKIKNIDPLAGLGALTSISLATSPSWDAAKRVLEIESLLPLSKLDSLRHVELFGVRPIDGSLKVLEDMGAIETAKFSQYPEAEVDRFFSVTNARREFNPKSSF